MKEIASWENNVKLYLADWGPNDVDCAEREEITREPYQVDKYYVCSNYLYKSSV